MENIEKRTVNEFDNGKYYWWKIQKKELLMNLGYYDWLKVTAELMK